MQDNRKRGAAGDVFVIPLSNRAFAVGQVLLAETPLASSIAIFDWSCASHSEALSGDLSLLHVCSLALVTPESLSSGLWPVVGLRPIEIPAALFPFQQFRSRGYVGATILGSGIINEFVEAYFGLGPWDRYRDPAFFDTQLLLAPDRKPRRVLFRRDFPSGRVGPAESKRTARRPRKR